MRRILTWMLILSILLVIGCSSAPNNTMQTEVPKTRTSEMETGSIAESSDKTDQGDEGTAAYPPSVMVDGIVYKDTGYISSMVKCGTMDGTITSTVDGTQLPTKNDQSNFGSGYEYQISIDDQLIVQIDGQYIIFRDIESKDNSIPDQVFNFKATVKEIKNGSLLVTYLDSAEGFKKLMAGDYSISAENLKDEVAVGDTVQIWFGGPIAESYPYQIKQVYRIIKLPSSDS